MDNSAEPAPRRGRGRPKGAGLVDPDDILIAAISAIAEGGYAGLSMRAVARQLGVSLSTVQHHFGTKAELWEAAVDFYYRGLERRRSATPPQGLVGRIFVILDASLAHPGFVTALLGDRSPGADERLAFVSQRVAERREEAAKVYGELREAGLTRPVEEEALHMLLMMGVGSIAGAPNAVRTIFGLDLDDLDEREHLATALADIIANGILSRAVTGTSAADQ